MRSHYVRKKRRVEARRIIDTQDLLINRSLLRPSLVGASLVLEQSIGDFFMTECPLHVGREPHPRVTALKSIANLILKEPHSPCRHKVAIWAVTDIPVLHHEAPGFATASNVDPGLLQLCLTRSSGVRRNRVDNATSAL